MEMVKTVVKNAYLHFDYVILTILGFLIIFNQFQPFDDHFARSLVAIILGIEVFIIAFVELGKEDSFWVRFFRRFSRFDVVFCTLLLVFYVAACNNWFYLAY